MKVLIVSHNCFSSSQSMGKTLASLFSKFDKSELMQLYFYPSVPNVDVCGDYYRITDKDILSSIIYRKTCGRVIEQSEIDSDNTLFSDPDEGRQYSRINRNSLLIHRLRDVAWKIGSWKTKSLKQWLKKGKPDIVFYALGDATFSQNIARWVSDYLGVPLVSYICDEFYSYYKNHESWFARIISFPLIRGIKKTIEASKRNITICDDLGKLYENTFNVPYTTIMTGSSFTPGELNCLTNSKHISYIGNTALNRCKPISEIAAAIEAINEENGTDFEFTYYGGKSNELESVSGIKYGGRLTAEQVKQTMANSCLLIHVETFDHDYRARLKYSISTKIADSLASGIPLFAYGPEDIASMKHLINNECAACVTDKKILYSQLTRVLMSETYSNQLRINAMSVASQKHFASNNGDMLRRVLTLYVLEQHL